MEARETVKRLLRFREAGNVRRAHTMPHIGEYTVGKHSFDAVTLLLLLHPAPPIYLVRAVLWHDVAERHAGDLPAPAKRADHHLTAAYEYLESRLLREKFGLADDFDSLTPEDENWLRAVDMLEFYFWCCDQEAFGNRHTEKALVNIQGVLEAAALPDPAREVFEAFRWFRHPEKIEFHE